MFKLYLTIIFLVLLYCGTAVGQFANDSLIYSESYYNTNNISSTYEKQLHTHNLLASLSYGLNLHKLFIGINQKFNSTVIRSSSGNIRDEEYLAMIGSYKLSNYVYTGISFKRNNFSDDRSLAINKSSIANTTLYTNIFPVSRVSITPFIGYSANTQVGIADNGTIYGANAAIDNLDLNEFIINSELNFKNEDINRRRNTDRLFNLKLRNELENNLSNTIDGFYSEKRKDFYFETDSVTKATFNISKNIQSRSEKRYYIRDAVNFFPSQSPLAFNIEARAGWREIDRNTKYKDAEQITSSSFDTNIEEFKLDFSSAFSYTKNNFGTLFRIIFSEQEEKHNAKYFEGASEITYEKRQETEAQKNNKSQQTTLTGSMNYKITNNDFLTVSLFHRKLVYNTQSETNFDDRDELLSMVGINYSRRLSPFFTLYTNLESSLNKISYIYSERSSNNNTRRTLKLASGGYYGGSVFTSKNDFEVSANYTVYEFEDLNPNFKSFAFRQFTFKDSSRIKIDKNVAITAYGYVKLSEQGDFVWDEFKGKPVRYLEEIFIEPKLEYKYKQIMFSAGVRYFSLSTFKFDSESNKLPDTEYISIGPTSLIEYKIYNSISIKCRGWYEFINNESNKKRELANLYIDVDWNI